MEKTILLLEKVLYYTENHGTLIYEGKNMEDYQKLKKNWFMIEKAR